jgi:predicted transcriptional regulator
MKTNLTLKVEKEYQNELSALAKSLRMSRSKLVLTAINEFVQKVRII